MTNKNKNALKYAYAGWFAAALFYCYQYTLRAVPGVMVNELRTDFGMSAEDFGTLGAYYLYAYAALQIPLGVIVDRIGVAKTLLGSTVLCIAGAWVLSEAQTVWMAQLSRILMGAGSAAAFMCPLKIAADYLSPGKRGFIMGATLMFGTVGALSAGMPLVSLLEAYGWRSAIFTTVWIGLIIAVLIFICVPKHHVKKETLDLSGLFGSMKNIFQNRLVMTYSIMAIGLYTPLAALADLWGAAFLMQKYELTREVAVNSCMMIYVGLALGSFTLPGLFERYNSLNLGIQICMFGILACFSFLLFGPIVSHVTLKVIMLMAGVFCGAEMMCFTGAVQYSSPKNSGITLGIVNTLNMLGGAVLQHIIGWLLDVQGNYTIIDGLRIYSTDSYVKAFISLWSVICVCLVVSRKLNAYEKAWGKPLA